MAGKHKKKRVLRQVQLYEIQILASGELSSVGTQPRPFLPDPLCGQVATGRPMEPNRTDSLVLSRKRSSGPDRAASFLLTQRDPSRVFTVARVSASYDARG